MKNRKITKQTLSVVLSVAMVATSVSISGIGVKADENDYATWVTTDRNLAYQKTASRSQQRDGADAQITDGIVDKWENFGAVTVDDTTANKGYFDIDLGKTYAASSIDQVVVWWRTGDANFYPQNGFKVQFGTSDVFTTVADVTEYPGEKKTKWEDENQYMVPIVLDKSSLSGNVSKVRIFMDSKANYGAQVAEIAVFSEKPADGIQMDKATAPAAITAGSKNYNEITYNVTAAEGQAAAGYKYNIYLDDKEVATGVEAGEGTIKDVTAGSHTLKAVSVCKGMEVSDAVEATVDVKDITEYYKQLFESTKNISSVKNNPNVGISDISSYFSPAYEGSEKNLTDGSLAGGEDEGVAFRTGKTSPQSFVIDLGREYKAAELDKVLLAFSNSRTNPTTYSIELSDNGADYTEVATGKSLKCLTDNAATAYLNGIDLDKLTDYKEENVRYVKVTLSEGAFGYGYVINEVSVIANTDNPTYGDTVSVADPADFTVESTEFGVINYNIKAAEGQEGYTYNVYLDGKLKAENVAAGEGKINVTKEGNYTVVVKTNNNGTLSRGLTKSVTVPDRVIPDGQNIITGNVWNLNNEADDWSDNKCGEGTAFEFDNVPLGNNWYSLMAHTTVKFEKGKTYTFSFKLNSKVKKQFLVACNTGGDKFLASSATAEWTGNDEEGYTCDYTTQFKWDNETQKQNFMIALGYLTAEKDGERGIIEDDVLATTASASVSDISLVAKTEAVEPSTEAPQPSTEAAQPSTEAAQPTTEKESEPQKPSYNPGFDVTGLEYKKYTCDGAEDIGIAIKDTTVDGVAPGYLDAGNTLQIAYSDADGLGNQAEVSINGETQAVGNGTLVMVGTGIIKINPTKLEENAYSVVNVKVGEKSLTFVVKKGNPVVEPSTDAPQSTTDAAQPSTEAPQPTTKAPETTDAVQPTTEVPQTTTKAAETTKAPETTTNKAVETTTEAPQPTTKAPETTKTPETTNKAVETTSADNAVKVAASKVTKATKKKSAKKISITLKKVKGVNGYRVEISTSKKFKKKATIAKNFKKVKVKFVSTKIKANKKYYVRVRAYKVVDKKTYYSKYSKVVKVKMK